jgi:hypothetical protein
MKTQEDYIKGLLETRRATDIFSTSLVANTDQVVTVDLAVVKKKEPEPQSLYQ